jgi:hypothetical protein
MSLFFSASSVNTVLSCGWTAHWLQSIPAAISPLTWLMIALLK